MFKRLQKKQIKNLKRKYHKLLRRGKKIFATWDQKSKPPDKLIVIQKQLRQLYQEIEQQKIDDELQFFAENPEVYQFLPSEWT
ncbi:hypothetical protein LT335_00045 [Spiroplasma sp. JKS002669]|uniref:hypothetical protein n=1 Tax=Spiroplasma attinicola TaxID=2904537 RepID=UPI0020BFABA3|nr:hypothetical protein [Spiroplasma sp. JKS002669]MCL6428506.1 hypothetical protein [Spiroplasma sp. JKS002669]